MKKAPLDPANAVILFADLQAGIIERTRTNELARLRRSVSALAKLAQLFDIPVIVTTWARCQLSGVKTSFVGETVPAFGLSLESTMVTFEVGRVRSATLTRVLPPLVVVARSDDAVISIAGSPMTCSR